MLPSLRIRGFRCFRDLTIPRLGRVNLVVGRNNSGKTTLLEALSVYAAGLDASVAIKRVLELRRETRAGANGAAHPDVARVFHCAPGRSEAEQAWFEIGPAQPPGRRLRAEIRTDRSEWQDNSGEHAEFDEPAALRVQCGGRDRLVPLSRLAPPAYVYAGRAYTVADSPEGPDAMTSYSVPPGGLDEHEIARLWGAITLTQAEDDVVAALRVVEPTVERVNVSTDPSRGGVSILVRRRGTRRRETLASLGDGMQHLFALALGLAQARGGLFLADEIENGLHYSVHEAMWRFIATTAARLGAQVVATTHSWDCIEGFQAAGIEDSLLIRLDRRGEDTFAVLFDERDVAIATRQSIDVR
jgi:predicted ATPase